MSQSLILDLHETSISRRRLGLMLILAVAVHAAIILGVGFGGEDRPHQRVTPTLDVTLVKSSQQKAPDEVDYLANANQQGSGNTREKVLPETLMPAEPADDQAPAASSGQPAATVLEQAPQRSEMLTSPESSEQVSVEPQPEEPADTPRISAAELISRSHDIASLEVEVGQSLRAYAQLPRRRFISANTRKHRYAAYMGAWRRKVERIGNLNFPEQARRQHLSGSLLLEVALLPDGRVESVEVIRSSGHLVLDDAAKRIVHLAAPFAPFPDGIRKDTDVLHITRTWKFIGGHTLTTGN